MIGIDSKKSVMTRLIARGLVAVHFDPSHKDATIPQHFRPLASTCFAYGYTRSFRGTRCIRWSTATERLCSGQRASPRQSLRRSIARSRTPRLAFFIS